MGLVTDFQRPTKEESIRREKESADLLGGKRIAGSGSGRHPGDIMTEVFLIDQKFTDKKSISVTRKMLHKISREAVEACRDGNISKSPCIELNFSGEERWYVVNETMFREMHDLLGG